MLLAVGGPLLSCAQLVAMLRASMEAASRRAATGRFALGTKHIMVAADPRVLLRVAFDQRFALVLPLGFALAFALATPGARLVFALPLGLALAFVLAAPATFAPALATVLLEVAARLQIGLVAVARLRRGLRSPLLQEQLG